MTEKWTDGKFKNKTNNKSKWEILNQWKKIIEQIAI